MAWMAGMQVVRDQMQTGYPARRQLSPVLSFIFTLIATIVFIICAVTVAHLIISPFLSAFAFFIFALLLGATLYCILTHTRGSRTVKKIVLEKKLREVSDAILCWLNKKDFSVRKKGNLIIGTKGRAGSSKIHFELMLKKKNSKCLVYGVFYTKSWPGPELDLREKVFLDRKIRRQGFALMKEFLNFVKKS